MKALVLLLVAASAASAEPLPPKLAAQGGPAGLRPAGGEAKRSPLTEKRPVPRAERERQDARLRRLIGKKPDALVNVHNI